MIPPKKYMKINTPKQRIKVYERLILDIDKGDVFFMCWRLIKYCGVSMEQLTELYRLQPKSVKYCWPWYRLDKKGMLLRKRKLFWAIEKAKS